MVIIAGVSDTPEAKIILGTSLNPDSIREGTDVYFDCIINAHPHVYKVEWRHDVSIEIITFIIKCKLLFKKKK